MFKLTIALLKFFALFVIGIFLAFPMSAICGTLPLFFTCLPLIWEIFWRGGLGLMILTSIALFIEGWNNGTKSNKIL